MSRWDLTGRKALVSGGARGIGATIARALADAGAAVMIGDILTDLGTETARSLQASGAQAGFVPLDVTRDESWAEDVATARASNREPAAVFRHLRAGAESGWDFSSRWLDDPLRLATIRTTRLSLQ